MNTINLTETQKKQILKSLLVLVDSREQENSHILQWLSKNVIPFKRMKLDSGDYSFMLPACPELGIPEDTYFSSEIFIERKNSLEELSQNFAQNRERFTNEFERVGEGCRRVVVIERGSYDDLINGRYNTAFDAKAYLASIVTFQHRYCLDIAFVSRENVAKYIYYQFYYYLREKLK